jgi:hypothetical protein
MMDYSHIVGKTGLIVTNVRIQRPRHVCNTHLEFLGRRLESNKKTLSAG